MISDVNINNDNTKNIILKIIALFMATITSYRKNKSDFATD